MKTENETPNMGSSVLDTLCYQNIGLPRYYTNINRLFYIKNKKDEQELLGFLKLLDSYDSTINVIIPKSFFIEEGWYSVYINERSKENIYIFIMLIDEIIDKTQHFIDILNEMKDKGINYDIKTNI